MSMPHPEEVSFEKYELWDMQKFTAAEEGQAFVYNGLNSC